MKQYVKLFLVAASVLWFPNVGWSDDISAPHTVKALDVIPLPTGRHEFYFQAGWNNTGTPILVPVIVLKGSEDGPRFLLTAGVHGDELNGIGVIHRLLGELDVSAIKGTLVAVPGVNQPGIIANNRRFYMAGSGGAQADLNRIMPGATEGSGAAELYAGAIWNNLLKPNADVMIDLHTQTRGSEYPLFVFADYANTQARMMAYQLMPDVIKADAGQKGTVETTFMEAGVPAVTFEIGGPKQFQPELIGRAVKGIKNVMRGLKMLDGAVEKPTTPPFEGKSYTNIYTKEGGVAVINVALMDVVEKGQRIATVYDPFGKEIRRYYAPHSGRVLSLATDPMREAGAMLVRILQ